MSLESEYIKHVTRVKKTVSTEKDVDRHRVDLANITRDTKEHSQMTKRFRNTFC